MATFAEVINNHEAAARQLIADGKVGEIEFSGFTYQVQVNEEEELWPFLQLGAGGKVRDTLCQCDEEPTCVHRAAALIRILGEGEEPLHERFKGSLWSVLCHIFADRQGYEAGILQEEEGAFLIRTSSGKEVFRMEAKNDLAREKLRRIVREREVETEETSLKFSGISPEELQLWKEGRPSPELRFELSFWSDIAKWMMLSQDGGDPYEITYGYSERGVPNEIAAAFPDLEVKFYISEANLAEVIPALKSVHSWLEVHDYGDQGIVGVVYDREKGSLKLERKEEVSGEAIGGIEVGAWRFVPGDGFYSREGGELAVKDEVPAEELGEFLTGHGRAVARGLEGEEIHSERLKPKYEIEFDGEWNLHIRCYLFESGDLHKGCSRHLGSWAYLEGKGFYPLRNGPFEQGERIVPAEKVSDFVHGQRSWLATQEGFATHLTAVESQIGYEVTEDESLKFEGKVELPEGAEGSYDFGEWIYLEGQGFYSKGRSRNGSPIRAGTIVKKTEVAEFIRNNREDLEFLEDFFTKECPVSGGSLRITLTSREQVKVKPKYDLHGKYRARDVVFYDEFVYLRHVGFCEIPMELRLPERFAHPVMLKGREMQLFLTYELQALKSFISHLDPRLKRVDLFQLALDEAEAEHGWLSLEMHYESSVGKVPLVDVWRALQGRKKQLFSDAGWFDLKDSRFSWIQGLEAERVSEEQGRVRLTTLEFIRLVTLENPVAEEGSAEARALLEKFTTLKPSGSPNLEGLRSQLRSYQKRGVEWLWFLHQNHLSALLCDDMGLGKTHQAMALLAGVLNGAPRPPRFLVVCPTSVIYHWREKLSEFLPELHVYTFYGPQRSLAHLSGCDVLLTSYGVLRSDKDRLAKIPFEVAVFDEIQVAKNTTSLTHGALRQIQARMRLGLTGTPIENSLRELKALFDIVLPTYLPPERQYREAFVLPIEKRGDEGKKAVLRRVIRPFVLRRKKEEVLTELPEKTEEKAHCELSPEQRGLYNETLLRNRDQLIHDLQDGSKPAPFLHVFAMLSHLKQICDHPAVHFKAPERYKEHKSGKWDLFIELLSQARESQQKVVVFSQYLAMLDIIEAYLKEEGIGFASIRGSTVRRDQQLEAFDKDPKCEVFVGSLQAVGLGVELTAASVVIHYDRWWNAAREQQATDRVHRMGQTRGVQVFKLLTLGTIEERIDALIEKKGALMEEVVGTDEQSQIKAFTREELMELLQVVGEGSGIKDQGPR